jgi:DNA-binding NarL/FixJ family response regulator
MVIMGTPLDRLELRYKASPSTAMLTASALGLEMDASIVIINRNQLHSDTICQSINDATRAEVYAFASVESSLKHRDPRPTLVLISVSGLTKQAEAQQLDLLLSSADDAPPVVVVGDRESPNYIMDILARGARGYIPTSLSLALTVKALCLVHAGGVFVPASCLRTNQARPHGLPALGEVSAVTFTERQIAVVLAIRIGKANKTIAYELNMCESTVKVHVRNIMKKLRATNRTQISFIADQMLKDGLLTPRAK